MPQESTYGYSTAVDMDFDEAIQQTTEALKEQGFGILTTIDVQEKMKEKLDKDMDEYTILGACNPKLAAQVLEAETEVGLLLPCNVIVYRDGDTVRVSAQLPSSMLAVINNPAVDAVAQKSEKLLKTVIDQLSA